MNVLSVDQVTHAYGIRPILKQVSFGIDEGEKVGLIGANGSGKSTLLRLILGLETPDQGRVHLNQAVSMAYLAQEPELHEGDHLLDAVLRYRPDVQKLRARFEEVSLQMSLTPESQALIDEFSHLQQCMDQGQIWGVEDQARSCLRQLGMKDASLLVAGLSGGERKKVALAGILLSDADFLLLDEPTNHLDTHSIEWLEDILADSQKTILLITHDRYFLSRLTKRILDLDQATVTSFEGDYSEYLIHKELQIKVDEQNLASRQNFLRRELEWVRRMPKARGTKSKFRLDQYEEIKAGLNQREKRMDSLGFPMRKKLGGRILEWEDLGVHLNQRWLFRHATHKMLAGEKMGIIGLNGSGKSTFLKCLLQLLEPSEGTVTAGASTEVSYLTQARLLPDESVTVEQAVADLGEQIPFGSQSLHWISYLERFDFRPADLGKRVHRLSGGEKARLLLARMVASQGNLLILDEPTNDLDLPTLRLLEDALNQFMGCALVVSHDRWFLDRVCTSIMEIGVLETPEYSAGNYSMFRLFQERRLKPVATVEKPLAVKADEPPVLFGNRQRKELAETESKIQAMEAALQDLQTKLQSQLNFDEYGPLQDRLASLKSDLNSQYSRWEELESQREKAGK